MVELHYTLHYLIVFSLYHSIAPSVTSTTSSLNSSNVISELYDITVTCTIHDRSTADQCVVMAVADGRATREGNVNIILHHTYLNLCIDVAMCMYIHTVEVKKVSIL